MNNVLKDAWKDQCFNASKTNKLHISSQKSMPGGSNFFLSTFYFHTPCSHSLAIIFLKINHAQSCNNAPCWSHSHSWACNCMHTINSRLLQATSKLDSVTFVQHPCSIWQLSCPFKWISTTTFCTLLNSVMVAQERERRCLTYIAFVLIQHTHVHSFVQHSFFLVQHSFLLVQHSVIFCFHLVQNTFLYSNQWGILLQLWGLPVQH